MVSEIPADFQNWHIWAWNLATSPRSCTYTLFLLQEVEIELLSLYGKRFLKYAPIFKIAIFGHETWPLAKVPEVTHIPCFYPRGLKLSLISLREVVSEIWANFQNGRIWAWNLAISQSSKSCTYILFLPHGGEIEIIFVLRAAVSEIYGLIFKMALFGHETWPLAKVPEVAHLLSFYPRQLKLSLFLLYGQRFPSYGPIFKIAIFGHKTWPLVKVPEVAHMVSFYPKGGNWAYFHSMGSGFQDTGRFSKLPYLGMKLGHWPKFQMLHIYFLNTAPSPEFHSDSLYGWLFPRYWQFCIFPLATMSNFNLFFFLK